MKKLSPVQKSALVKAFRAMKRAAEAGERFVIDSDDKGVDVVAGQVRGMVELAAEMDNALQLYVGADHVLAIASEVQPRVNRKGLKLVKGGR